MLCFCFCLSLYTVLNLLHSPSTGCNSPTALHVGDLVCRPHNLVCRPFDRSLAAITCALNYQCSVQSWFVSMRSTAVSHSPQCPVCIKQVPTTATGWCSQAHHLASSSAIKHKVGLILRRWIETAHQRRPVGAAGGKGGATYLPAATPAGMGAAGTLASGGRPADMTKRCGFPARITGRSHSF
jgi:hypothetical protein